VDFLIAAIVVLAAGRSKPGPDLALAFDVRKMAIESVQADARYLKLTVDALGEEVKSVKANIVRLVEKPLDVAAQRELVPAALSIMRAMRSRKEHA
jgi:hypothetical protein